MRLPCADGRRPSMPSRLGGRSSLPICAADTKASQLLRRCHPHAGRCLALGDRTGLYKKCFPPEGIKLERCCRGSSGQGKLGHMTNSIRMARAQGDGTGTRQDRRGGTPISRTYFWASCAPTARQATFANDNESGAPTRYHFRTRFAHHGPLLMQTY